MVTLTIDGNLEGREELFSDVDDDVTGCCRMAKRDLRLAAAPEMTPASVLVMALGGTALELLLLLPPPFDDTGLLVLAEMLNLNIYIFD